MTCGWWRARGERQQAREGAAAHWFAGFDILLDDLAQDGGRAHVQARRKRGGCGGLACGYGPWVTSAKRRG